MEKLNDMQHNQIADDELEQVAGGRNLFKVFTTEFREFFNESKDQENLLEMPEDNHFGVSTLEMRANPMQKQGKKKPHKDVKL